MSSNRITTTHLGHEIAYDEDQDVWECSALILKAKTLTALRKKIDQIDLARRRLPDGGVPVCWFENYSSTSLTHGRAVAIDRDGANAWVIYTTRIYDHWGRNSRIGEKRTLMGVGALLPFNDKVTALAVQLTLAADKEAAAREATKAARAAVLANAFTAETLRAAGAPEEASDA